MSKAQKLAEALAIFNEALFETVEIAESIGGDSAAMLESWYWWTGQVLSTMHAISQRAEAGQSLSVPCAECGALLGMIEVWHNETLCADCAELLAPRPHPTIALSA